MPTLYLLLLVLIPILLLLFIRKGSPHRYLTWRLIRALRYRNALSADTAIPATALGLNTEKRNGNPFIEMLFGLGLNEETANRDALRYLLKQDVVKMTEDGNYYLSEETLKTKKFI